MKYSRLLTAVIERLRSTKTYSGKCALFMGAGCSTSAGIPNAEGCLKIIQGEYPRAVQNRRQKTVGGALATLSPAERERVVALCLEGARLNWTHLCVASLLKGGFLQRVLTVNFDPLIMQACACLGFLPQVLDLDQLAKLDPALIDEPVVILLRGQGAALRLLASEEEAKAHKEQLGAAFNQASSRYLWLVAGYDGRGEPEYAQFSGIKLFEKELYWVGEAKEPPEHLTQDLLRLGRNAFYVPQFTSDEFFLALCRALELFPPPFITNPFSFLRQLLDAMTPFPATGQKSDEANLVFKKPLAWVDDAIARYEMGAEALEEDEEEEGAAAPRTLAREEAPPSIQGPPDARVMDKVRGLFEDHQFKQVVDELEPFAKEALDNDTAYLLSRAHMMYGNGLLAAAKKKSRQEAVPILEEAVHNYENAVQLNPNCYQSLNNWGYALKFQAELHDGPRADKLLRLSIEKYELALKVKPDCHQVLNNWGHALKMRADHADGQKSENLLKEAIGKYQAALSIKDDDFTALHNWGNALLAQADRVGGAEGDRLRAEGMKKMKAAQAVMLLRT